MEITDLTLDHPTPLPRRRAPVLLVVLLLATAALLLVGVGTPASAEPPVGTRARRDQPVVIGHRGTRTDAAPEDTLPAFRYAERYADVIEFDIRWTRDGRMVALHDATLDRTTNCTGAVADRSWAYVRRCDAGSWRGARFAGTRIPTFEQVLAATRGHEIAPEIKADATPAQVRQFYRMLVDHGDLSLTIVQGFDKPTQLRQLKGIDPRVQIAYTTRKTLTAAQLRGFDYYWPYYRSITRTEVTAIQHAGIRVAPWTVDRDGFAAVIAMHPWGICTDDPHGLSRALV